MGAVRGEAEAALNVARKVTKHLNASKSLQAPREISAVLPAPNLVPASNAAKRVIFQEIVAKQTIKITRATLVAPLMRISVAVVVAAMAGTMRLLEMMKEGVGMRL